MSKPKLHTPGKVRYFLYRLVFPTGEMWQDNISFVHSLDFELKQTRWHKYEPNVYRDLLQKGEARFKDQNGVMHVIAIEDKPRERHWGTKGGAHKMLAH